MNKALRENPRFLYILVWVGVMTIHFLLLLLEYQAGFYDALAEAFVYNAVYALLGSGLWYMVRFSNLKSKSVWSLILNHLMGSLITVSLWLSISYFLLQSLLNPQSSWIEHIRDTTFARAIIGFFVYAVIVTIYYLIISFRELNEKILREAELSKMLREAELSMLRSQVRPHFLFNSLNSISSLTISNPQKAQDMVIKLSEFVRYSLRNTDEKLIPLVDEIYHINLYLEIEKTRFGEKLDISFDVPESCEKILLPSLILQPLVENSIKYGIYESTGDIKIHLGASCDNYFLYLKIGNDFDPEASPKKGTGNGLEMVRKRLEKIYLHHNLMQVNKKDRYFEVEIKIPRHAEA